MNGRGRGGHNGRCDQNDGHSGGRWNDNGGVCNIGAVGTDRNDGGQGNETAGEVMMHVDTIVLNMVVDLVVEHIVIDYLGHKHCLLVLFMNLSKR
jgi:hypothetical protein